MTGKRQKGSRKAEEFWEAVKEEIPERQRAEGRAYKRKSGGGRKLLPDAACIRKDILCFADRLSIESCAQIRSGEQPPQIFLGMGQGKMGTKRNLLTDEYELPLSAVLSGANTRDVKLLEDTLEHIVVLRTEPGKEHPQNLCLDAGYTGSEKKVQAHSCTLHIRPRGEEKKELERNLDFHARR